MIEYVNSLTPQEAEELKRTIRDLMRQSCIIETKYDTDRDCLKDNPRYRVCMRHREFLTDYFDIMGCTLVFDPQDHFFRLSGDGVGLEKFSETTTLFILLMKLIYKEKIMGEGLKSTVTNLEEVRRHGVDTGILNRKLTDREVYEAVSVMKTHQMLEIPCAIGDLEDDTPIYLYNMINVFCRGAAVTELYQRYKKREEEAADGLLQERLRLEEQGGEAREAAPGLTREAAPGLARDAEAAPIQEAAPGRTQEGDTQDETM